MRLSQLPVLLMITGLATLAVPLIYGSAKGLAATIGNADRLAQSYDLLKAYRDHSSPPVALASRDFSTDIRECGYEEATLFPSDEHQLIERDEHWTPYGGYFDLLMLRSRIWHEHVERLRANLLAERATSFSSEFLRVCMRQSIFAPFCARRVRAILRAGDLDIDSGGLPAETPRFDLSRQTRTICTYLDGIAAYHGMQIAGRPH